MKKAFARGLSLLVLLLVAFTNVRSTYAYEEEGLSISVPFITIMTERKTISVPLTVENNFNRSLVVSFEVSCPAGWRYSLIFQGYNVSEIFLRPNKTASLSLRLEPGEEIKAGSYTFTIRALSEPVKSNLIRMTINIQKPVEEVELKATVESVTGSPGSTFTFRFNIANRGYRDLTFALSATVPGGWYILGFRPSAYERRAISEITVKAQETYSGAIFEVWCPEKTPPGEYPVTITASAEGIENSLELEAVVTGTPRISLRTQEEVLSYGVNAGESKEIILVVENEGTTDLLDVTIRCSTPYGWKTVASPDKLNILPAGENASVSLIISPPAGAIAGDYSASVRVSTRETSDEIKLRITVTKPTYWGIIGLVVVVLSVFGLMFVFRKYGRP